jgi:carbonic anhydrase
MYEKEFMRLAQEGQTPKSLFIGCSDSRLIPELITNSSAGQLFVVRTAGNFVPVAGSQQCLNGVGASIQYAVEVLGVKEIIICGHSKCGAIEALFADQVTLSQKMPMVADWISLGLNAKIAAVKQAKPNATTAELVRICEHLSIVEQLNHLMTYDFIKSKVDAEEIHLHGWYFDIANGSIEYFDPNQKGFVELKKNG